MKLTSQLGCRLPDDMCAELAARLDVSQLKPDTIPPVLSLLAASRCRPSAGEMSAAAARLEPRLRSLGVPPLLQALWLFAELQVSAYVAC